MARYIIRRLLWACVLFIAVTMVTYIIFFIIPNDPAVLAAGKSATPADIERVRVFLGLNHSVPVQYLLFLKRLVLHLDLGQSFVNRRSVNTMVIEAAPVTASLVFGGAILWMICAIPIGILAALKPRSIMDRSAMIFVLIGISFPAVVLGLTLQYTFGFWWPILPNRLLHHRQHSAGGVVRRRRRLVHTHDPALGHVRVPLHGDLRPDGAREHHGHPR